MRTIHPYTQTPFQCCPRTWTYASLISLLLCCRLVFKIFYVHLLDLTHLAVAVPLPATPKDFGLATNLGPTATHASNFRLGTPFYTAPEVRQRPHVAHQVRPPTPVE